MASKAFSSPQIEKLHKHCETGDISTGRFDKAGRGGESPARSKQVVHKQRPLAGSNGVSMDFDGVLAVLQRILDAVSLEW